MIPSYDAYYEINSPLSAEDVFKYASDNNKPTDENSDIGPNIIDPKACARQNVSDSVHDGLKEIAAQSALPQVYGFENIQHQSEDEHLEEFLYKLNKLSPDQTTLKDHMKANYESYFRVPLFNGGNTNVDANGVPIYRDRVSVIESMLDKIGVANPNVFLSYDFGFPELKYDIGYSKTRQFYVGYRPCQENDAAGKPTLSSSNANGFGLLSTQVPVEFIWTNRAIEPFFTYLPKYTGTSDLVPHNDTPQSENYALSRFDMYIGWDRSTNDSTDKNEADVLKSNTIFYDPSTKELLLSNSDWTSKSGKDHKQYEKFSNELLSIKDKSPIELLSPKPIITGHNLQTAQFDIFHALAKNSGDKLTAITYPNSYTKEMLDSVITIIRKTDKSFLPNYINKQQLNDPVEAGKIAEAIDAIMTRNSSGEFDMVVAAMSKNEIEDLITTDNYTEYKSYTTKLRSKPRLFKKLINKSEPISDEINYTYMWLTDYVFVYVTHDRLAAACALERFVDVVILESPRQDNKSVFSLFVRKNTKDPIKMLNINIQNIKDKITKLSKEDGSINLSVFGIPVTNQPFKPIEEIKKEIGGMRESAKQFGVSPFKYDLNDDDVLKVNINNGLIINLINEISDSYDKLIESFKNILGIGKETDIDEQLLGAGIEEHIAFIIDFFVKDLNVLAYEMPDKIDDTLQPEDFYKLKEDIDKATQIFYRAKDYLQTFNAFQELYDKMTLLSRIQSPIKLDKLAGITDPLAKLLTQTTKDQISGLKPVEYIKENNTEARKSRSISDWLSSSKAALKRVISSDLPKHFGLPKLFIKLIPMMSSEHVIAIFTYFRNIAYEINVDANSKIDFKITMNCLNTILSADVFSGTDKDKVKKILDKLNEYDELFTLIDEEEKTMVKQLEKASKMITKCISKKQQLLQATKDAELSARIKEAVNTLIPKQSGFFGIGGKSIHKYKLRNRGKNTRKYRKSGGENPVSKIEKTPDNVKYRITNFYRYITMYILYLTNVIELYSNIPKNNSSYPTALIDIIANLTRVRDVLVVIIIKLSEKTGRTLIANFNQEPLRTLNITTITEYDKSSDDIISVDPNDYKDEIYVSLMDSFNLHLVNVGTYFYNLELIPVDDVNGIYELNRDLMDELNNVLDNSHSEIIEYVFVNDVTAYDEEYDATIESRIDKSIQMFAQKPNFNFGYNGALIVLLKTSQLYLLNAGLNKFSSKPSDMYNFALIENSIENDLRVFEIFDRISYKLVDTSITFTQKTSEQDDMFPNYLQIGEIKYGKTSSNTIEVRGFEYEIPSSVINYMPSLLLTPSIPSTYNNKYAPKQPDESATDPEYTDDDDDNYNHDDDDTKVPSARHKEIPSALYKEIPSALYKEIPSALYKEIPSALYKEIPSARHKRKDTDEPNLVSELPDNISHPPRKRMMTVKKLPSENYANTYQPSIGRQYLIGGKATSNKTRKLHEIITRKTLKSKCNIKKPNRLRKTRKITKLPKYIKKNVTKHCR
jgi:hypothetical protein